MTCKTCIHWMENWATNDGVALGDCRRHAPIANIGTTADWDKFEDCAIAPQVPAFWPVTASFDWCGEQKDKTKFQKRHLTP